MLSAFVARIAAELRINRQEHMAVGQSRVGQGIFWILRDRLLKIFGRLLQVCAGPAVPKVAAFQVKLMRLGVIGRARRKHMLRRAAQLCLQRISNAFRDLAFDRENVGQLAIVGVGPKMRIGQSVYQPNGDAHPVAADFWTLPSRMFATPSCFAISGRRPRAL